MSYHGDSQLISRCLLGETSAEDRAHLQTCPSCRLELEQCESALLGFRGSVRERSRNEAAAALHTAPPVGKLPAGWGIPVRWSMAAALLLAVLGLKISLQQPVSLPALRATPEGDIALLNHVSLDVARRVPSGMEPLLALGSPLDGASEPGNETLP